MEQDLKIEPRDIVQMARNLEKIRKRYRMGYLVSGAIIIVLAISTVVLFNIEVVAYPAVTVISLSLVPCMLLYHVINGAYQKRYKKTLIDKLVEATGFAFNERGSFPVTEISLHNILPDHEDVYAKNGLSGVFSGIVLDLETCIFTKGGLTFEGLLIRLRFPRKLEGHTVIYSRGKRSMYDPRFKALQKITFSGINFGKEYDAQCSDLVEAKVLINTGLRNQIRALKNRLKSRWLAVSFKDNEMIIFMRRSDHMLNTMPMWKSVNSESLSQALQGITVLSDLMNAIKGHQQLA